MYMGVWSGAWGKSKLHGGVVRNVGRLNYMGVWSAQCYQYYYVWKVYGKVIHFGIIAGFPPFCSEKPQDTYRKIMNWQQHLIFSPELPPISADAEHLIKV